MPFHVCHFQYNVYVKNLFNTHYGLKCTGTIDVCFDFVNWTTTERGEKTFIKRERKKRNGKRRTENSFKQQQRKVNLIMIALSLWHWIKLRQHEPSSIRISHKTGTKTTVKNWTKKKKVSRLMLKTSFGYLDL